MVSLFLGAYDDGLGLGALQVFSALTAAPPQHRTVFVNDHGTILHKEASLSDSLFDIVIAAGDSMLSVDQILLSRKLRSSISSNRSKVTAVQNSDGRNNGDGNSSSCFYGPAMRELVDTSFPSRKKFHSKKEKVLRHTNIGVTDVIHDQQTNKACVSSYNEPGSGNSEIPVSGLGFSENSPSSYDTPSNIILVDKNERSSLQVADSKTTATLSIGNWKRLTNEELATDERPLMQIFFEDFVLSSTDVENHRDRGDGGEVRSKTYSSLRENGLCLIWRLRFIRCQYYKHSYYRSALDSSTKLPSNASISVPTKGSLPIGSASIEKEVIEMEGMVGVKIFYQAVNILMASHPNSAKISSFFSRKGDRILTDLIAILECKQRKSSIASDGSSNSYIVDSQELSTESVRLENSNGSSNKNVTNSNIYKSPFSSDISTPTTTNDLPSHESAADFKVEMESAIINMNLPGEIYTLACQCLISILSRAEDVDEDDGRRDKSHMKQMPPFECIQERLGLERGQMGGLLVNLLREELVFLSYCGSNRALTVSETTLSVDTKGSKCIPLRSDITIAIATEGSSRLLWVEQLLLIAMACLPLPGVLTTIVDNGFMSLFQSALTSPEGHLREIIADVIVEEMEKMAGVGDDSERMTKDRQKALLLGNILNEDSEMGRSYGVCLTREGVRLAIDGAEDKIELLRQWQAFLDLRVCVDSFLVQVLDMVVASKQRAIRIFHQQGGYGMIINRLKYETQRQRCHLSKVIVTAVLIKDVKKDRSSISQANYSLLLSLVSLIEILLDPNQDEDEEISSNGSISTPSASEIVLSDGFCDVFTAVLSMIAVAFNSTGILPTEMECPLALLAACLSLLESLIRDDPSNTECLTLFLSNGLVKAAWLASNRGGLPHNEESLLAILNFIFCLCISEDGLRLVQLINPFPLILSCFHDRSLLRMEADIPLLLSDTPSRVGDKLGELVRLYPTLLPPCMRSLIDTTDHITSLLTERTRSRFLMVERVCTTVDSGVPGHEEISSSKEVSPIKSARASQGDLSVFYFSIAALTCLDEMVSQERTVGNNKSNALKNFLEQGKGLQLFLKMTFGLMGSDSYTVTSLACRAKSELGAVRPLSPLIEGAPGFPPLLSALQQVQRRIITYRPVYYFDGILTEIELQTAKLSTLLGPNGFKGFLSSVSCTAGDLCDFTNPINGASISSDQPIAKYCDILRIVVFLSHLMDMLKKVLHSRTDALRHMSQDKKEAEMALLFGVTEVKDKDQKSEGAEHKTAPGLMRVFQVLSEGGLYLSCIDELVRGQGEGFWEVAAKKGTGEEKLMFELFVVGHKVSVKDGLSPESRRSTRLMTGSTVEAYKRVANHVTWDKVRYRLSKEASGEDGEAWVGACHSSMHPPQAIVDVVGVLYGQDRVLHSHEEDDVEASIPGSSPPLSVRHCEDAVSLRMAGATALSFFESSTQQLLYYLSVLSSASVMHYSESSGDGWVKKGGGGANLRPLGVSFPDKILLLADNIAATLVVVSSKTSDSASSANSVNADPSSEVCGDIKTGTTSNQVCLWDLKDIIRFSHALRLCAASTHSDNDHSNDTVSEVAVMHLLHYKTKVLLFPP